MYHQKCLSGQLLLSLYDNDLYLVIYSNPIRVRQVFTIEKDADELINCS